MKKLLMKILFGTPKTGEPLYIEHTKISTYPDNLKPDLYDRDWSKVKRKPLK